MNEGYEALLNGLERFRTEFLEAFRAEIHKQTRQLCAALIGALVAFTLITAAIVFVARN